MFANKSTKPLIFNNNSNFESRTKVQIKKKYKTLQEIISRWKTFHTIKIGTSCILSLKKCNFCCNNRGKKNIVPSKALVNNPCNKFPNANCNAKRIRSMKMKCKKYETGSGNIFTQWFSSVKKYNNRNVRDTTLDDSFFSPQASRRISTYSRVMGTFSSTDKRVPWTFVSEIHSPIHCIEREKNPLNLHNLIKEFSNFDI